MLGLVREQPGLGQLRLHYREVPDELRGPVHRLELLPAQAVIGQGAVAVGRTRGRDGRDRNGLIEKLMLVELVMLQVFILRVC